MPCRILTNVRRFGQVLSEAIFLRGHSPPCRVPSGAIHLRVESPPGRCSSLVIPLRVDSPPFQFPSVSIPCRPIGRPGASFFRPSPYRHFDAGAALCNLEVSESVIERSGTFQSVERKISGLYGAGRYGRFGSRAVRDRLDAGSGSVKRR